MNGFETKFDDAYKRILDEIRKLHDDGGFVAGIDRAATARKQVKPLNFGRLPGEVSRDILCKKCGGYASSFHTQQLCTYTFVRKQMKSSGCVVVKSMWKDVLKEAGIPVSFHETENGVEPIKLQWKTKHERKKLRAEICRMGYYAPVWALLICEESHVKKPQALGRKGMRQLLRQLREAADDISQQQVIAAEHMIRKGRYSEECRIFLGVPVSEQDYSDYRASLSSALDIPEQYLVPRSV